MVKDVEKSDRNRNRSRTMSSRLVCLARVVPSKLISLLFSIATTLAVGGEGTLQDSFCTFSYAS